MSAVIFVAVTALVYAAGQFAIDARLRRNASWWLYFYTHFHRSISMSLTQAQLDQFDAAWQSAKAAAIAANTAAATAAASAAQAASDAAASTTAAADETAAVTTMIQLADSFVATPAAS